MGMPDLLSERAISSTGQPEEDSAAQQQTSKHGC